jgi:hypothetical protein
MYLQDQDDLPFKKGEVLTVLSKDEEQWWTARNSLGQTGSIPVPYIQKVAELYFAFYHSMSFSYHNCQVVAQQRLFVESTIDLNTIYLACHISQKLNCCAVLKLVLVTQVHELTKATLTTHDFFLFVIMFYDFLIIMCQQTRKAELMLLVGFLSKYL